MTSSLVRFSLVVILLFNLLAGLAAAADEADKKTIAILPLATHAKNDISYLKTGIMNMLASRLAANADLKIADQALASREPAPAGQLDKEEVLRLGQRLQADYLLGGSLTAIGNSYSLDARLYTVPGDKPVETFYASAGSEDDIIQAVDMLAWGIAEKSFGKKRPRQGVQQTAANRQPPMIGESTLPAGKGDGTTSPYTTAHPDRSFIQGYPGGAYGGSPFITPSAITGLKGFTKTQNLSLSLQGLDVGDIDGDGRDDLVVADRNEIVAYHLNGNRLIKFGAIKIPVRFKIIAVNLADINENGKAEIYATGVDWIDPTSLAAEWQGKDFDYLFEEQRWYVRPLRVPGQGLVLAGQRPEVNEAFAPGIYQIALEDGRIREESLLPVPDSVNLYDFSLADLEGDGTTEVVAIDKHDRLRILTVNGKKLWESSDHYGGSLRYVGGLSRKAKTTIDDNENREKERIYIPSRIIIEDVNNDHLPDIIVNKNLSTASRIMKNLKNYPSGEIHALTWNGIGLTEMWRTRKIDGYVASYQFAKDAENTDTAHLYVGLVMNSGWMDVFSAKESTVLIYPLDLSQPPGEEREE